MMIYTLADIVINMAWIWLAIIIITALLEAYTFDLISIWFTFAAVVALIFGLFNVPPVVQMVIFLAVSVALLLVTRPIAIRYFKSNTIQTNVDAIVGKVGVVTKSILENDRGEVKVNGAIWTAISDEVIQINEKIEVLAVEGVKLVVKKI